MLNHHQVFSFFSFLSTFDFQNEVLFECLPSPGPDHAAVDAVVGARKAVDPVGKFGGIDLNVREQCIH